MAEVKKVVKAVKKAEAKKAVKKTESKKVVKVKEVSPEEKLFIAFFKKNGDKLKKMRTAEEKCKVAFLAGFAAGLKAKK